MSHLNLLGNPGESFTSSIQLLPSLFSLLLGFLLFSGFLFLRALRTIIVVLIIIGHLTLNQTLLQCVVNDLSEVLNFIEDHLNFLGHMAVQFIFLGKKLHLSVLDVLSEGLWPVPDV
jgi:hypothetical protein